MAKLVYVLAVVGGVLAALGGLVMGSVLMILALLGRSATTPLPGATMGLALVLVGLGFGAASIWAGLTSLNHAPEREFSLPGWGALLVGDLVALALGQLAFSAGGPLVAVVPVFHIAVGALAALMFLALALAAAAAHGGFVSGRAGWGSLAWGSLGGSALAMVAELLLILVLAAMVGIYLGAAQPGLLRNLQNWLAEVERTGQVNNLGPLARTAASPWVALGVLALLGVVIPIIEELSKSLAVPLIGLAGRRLTRLDGFLLGMAAGAGFTLVEGILNGALALESPHGWAGLMFIRGGTAAIHCLASGLAGLGWQALIVERRVGRGLLHGALAVAVHGSWNIGAGVSGLAALTGQGAGARATGQLLQTLATAGMVVLWIIVVAAIPIIARSLADDLPPSPPQVTTPEVPDFAA